MLRDGTTAEKRAESGRRVGGKWVGHWDVRCATPEDLPLYLDDVPSTEVDIQFTRAREPNAILHVLKNGVEKMSGWHVCVV